MDDLDGGGDAGGESADDFLRQILLRDQILDIPVLIHRQADATHQPLRIQQLRAERREFRDGKEIFSSASRRPLAEFAAAVQGSALCRDGAAGSG